MFGKWAGSALLALVPIATMWVGACGTDAVGIETCRQIEEARCRRAPDCPDIDLSKPPHRGSPATDVDACIRFYRDACLHGLAVADPGAVTTKACIDAIGAGSCTVVEHPETAAACAWLIPPAPSPATDASDGPADAIDAAPDTPPSDAGLGFDLGIPLGQ
jgi:hypothetical protein